MSEAECARDSLVPVLLAFYGNSDRDRFLFLDGLSYHQHAAQSILRVLADQAKIAVLNQPPVAILEEVKGDDSEIR